MCRTPRHMSYFFFTEILSFGENFRRSCLIFARLYNRYTLKPLGFYATFAFYAFVFGLLFRLLFLALCRSISGPSSMGSLILVIRALLLFLVNYSCSTVVLRSTFSDLQFLGSSLRHRFHLLIVSTSQFGSRSSSTQPTSTATVTRLMKNGSST